ncbi:MAG: TRAP transporter large permease subunit [Burkholderiales bacterium]|jgi:TRAP-type mannitol/chloroaromatic compound transport system permease large subunit|nr:TRAP transporter large permease subunit [Burkholderiales bacterium]
MKMRKELWFGFTIMALIVVPVLVLTPWTEMTNGVLGLLMLALVVVAIMLGFPTAFTLMGMGVMFSWFFYRSVDPDMATRQVLDLMVQRTYGVMSNDVLIAVPLFVFMGYLVERAALIERLFKSLHLALARLPGSLAVATIITCAIFATATGIVGAVVTLMGLLALPAMLRAGYHTQIAAGSVTAGGCLGILIPPSVLLIVYGATAGVSVVQLYAGAFFPGLMLAMLYVGYVIVLAMIKPKLMPPLPDSERRVELPAFAQALAARGRHATLGLFRALGGGSGVPARTVAGQLLVSLLPALAIAAVLAFSYRAATAPVEEFDTSGLIEAGASFYSEPRQDTGLLEPAGGTGLQEPPVERAEEKAAESTGLQEPPVEGAAEKPAESSGLQEPPGADRPAAEAGAAAPAEPSAGLSEPPAAAAEPRPVPTWFWVMAAVGVLALVLIYALWTWQRFEIFKMLLGSFFPLSILILAVLGSIVFGFATPTEAAAVGAFGGFVLAAAYRFIAHQRGNPGVAAVGTTVKELGVILKESSFLTAKTSAMVCWLFVGSAIFSAAFALLGGQEIIENWVLSLGLTPIQFMILAQCIIFILGWPLEWTEIIVIFMPIFIPLLPKFGIDPLFFGLLVALNLQTAFLSPPVAMSAFYLKGVAPPHVTLNQIFLGMMPFMGIQVIALVLLYTFPEIGLWLPQLLYR